jgi:hypothetical protein
MKRSERMLSMAKAKSKVDEEIGRMLDIPKYETTKGLERRKSSSTRRPITRYFCVYYNR